MAPGRALRERCSPACSSGMYCEPGLDKTIQTDPEILNNFNMHFILFIIFSFLIILAFPNEKFRPNMDKGKCRCYIFWLPG